MAKKGVLVLVFAALAAGAVFAQEAGLSFESIGFGGGLELAPLADGSGGSSSGGFLTGSKFTAGLLNVPLGAWSWLNKDWLGGGITAGLEVGGIVVFLIGSGALGRTFDPLLTIAGLVAVPIGAVYGFKRGWKQWGTLQQAGSLAEALRENPLKHMNLAVVPNGEGGVAGVLSWRAAW